VYKRSVDILDHQDRDQLFLYIVRDAEMTNANNFQGTGHASAYRRRALVAQ